MLWALAALAGPAITAPHPLLFLTDRQSAPTSILSNETYPHSQRPTCLFRRRPLVAALSASAEATAEVAAMIDLTAEADARSFAKTEAGARLLKLRPDLDEFAEEIADCIHGVASGELQVTEAAASRRPVRNDTSLVKRAKLLTVVET